MNEERRGIKDGGGMIYDRKFDPTFRRSDHHPPPHRGPRTLLLCCTVSFESLSKFRHSAPHQDLPSLTLLGSGSLYREARVSSVSTLH